jgi:hypothetical protein
LRRSGEPSPARPSSPRRLHLAPLPQAGSEHVLCRFAGQTKVGANKPPKGAAASALNITMTKRDRPMLMHLLGLLGLLRLRLREIAGRDLLHLLAPELLVGHDLGVFFLEALAFPTFWLPDPEPLPELD